MFIEITDISFSNDIFSYVWEGDTLKVVHNRGGRVFSVLYDSTNTQSSLLPTYIDDNSLSYDFSGVTKPTDSSSWGLLISTPSLRPEYNLDGEWAFEYYAGEISDVMLFCKSLNIGGGRLSKISDSSVYYYMKLVNDFIDGYLTESYFLPIRRYNRVLPNGQVEKVFPGKVRLCAIQWTAGLLLISEFQTQEPNMNEMGNKLIEEAKREIHQMTLWNMRLPGQRFKSNVSRTLPPGMQVPLNPELLL